jgi:NTP pyrophosphatase (non-canonical NTP hydrolase)
MRDAMIKSHELPEALTVRFASAHRRYGLLSSTHEGLGVALEEWNELCDAVRSNDLEAVQKECLDLAAVLLRMADACYGDVVFKKRSVK